MNKKELSFVQVIQNDYAASLSFLFPIVFLGIIGFLILSEKNVSSTFLLVATIISAIAVLALIWRFSEFHSVFNDGLEVQAVIDEIVFLQGRGHITYIYTFQGQKYQNKNFVQKTSRTKAINVGDQVILVIDRNNPKHSFIRDLYN